VFLQALQETLERQGEILAYIEKKKQKKSKVTKKYMKKQNETSLFTFFFLKYVSPLPSPFFHLLTLILPLEIVQRLFRW
jgi:UDP-N-acetylglucosamine:LPS N-acetylglucosamine transferase